MSIKTRLSRLEDRQDDLGVQMPAAIIFCRVELDPNGRRVSEPGFAIFPGTEMQLYKESCESSKSFLKRVQEIQGSATGESET